MNYDPANTIDLLLVYVRENPAKTEIVVTKPLMLLGTQVLH